jgi:hypothetical protein
MGTAKKCELLKIAGGLIEDAAPMSQSEVRDKIKKSYNELMKMIKKDCWPFLTSSFSSRKDRGRPSHLQIWIR